MAGGKRRTSTVWDTPKLRWQAQFDIYVILTKSYLDASVAQCFLLVVTTDAFSVALCLRVVQSVFNLTTEQCPFPLIL